MNTRIRRLSVVIPSFNEEDNVPVLAGRLKAVLEAEITAGNIGDYDLLFVDDGSKDGTLDACRRLAAADARVRYLSFSRNFGHQAALRAGIENATGDAIVSLDADMQHPPELIPDLIRKANEGFDVVCTIRKNNDSTGLFKRTTSSLFYTMINTMGEIDIRDGAADFRLLMKNAADALRSMPETAIFFRGAVSWIGFNQVFVEYMPHKRLHGSSKYSLKKMIKLALEGTTAFSIKPLHLATSVGIVSSISAFGYAAWVLAYKLIYDKTVTGWASLIIVMLFLGGVQLISLGIIGEYIGRLFTQSMNRPNYIVKESKLTDRSV